MTKPTQQPDNLSIGARLKFVRLFLGKTQAQMASALSVSHSTYNNWETGYAAVSMAGTRALKEKFQISMDFLHYGEAHQLPDALLRAWMEQR